MLQEFEVNGRDQVVVGNGRWVKRRGAENEENSGVLEVGRKAPEERDWLIMWCREDVTVEEIADRR